MSRMGGRPGWGRGRVLGVAGGVLFALGVVVLLTVGLVNRDRSNAIDLGQLDRGQAVAAPDIRLPVLVAGHGVGPVGSPFSLAQLRGRPVVLNVWASWCGPCRQEAPVLERAWRRFRDRPGGPVFLGLDTQDLSGKALAFVRRYGISYPSLRDGSKDSEERLGATGVPETYLIDGAGRIRAHFALPLARASEASFVRLVGQLS